MIAKGGCAMAERPADSVRSIEAARPLRIGLLVGPMVPVPPIAYGGTERVVAALAAELSRRGHDVTVFASADSQVEAALEPIARRSLWREGFRGDVCRRQVTHGGLHRRRQGVGRAGGTDLQREAQRRDG